MLQLTDRYFLGRRACYNWLIVISSGTRILQLTDRYFLGRPACYSKSVICISILSQIAAHIVIVVAGECSERPHCHAGEFAYLRVDIHAHAFHVPNNTQ